MKYDLQKRLIGFSVSILGLEKSIRIGSIGSRILVKQILRSSTSPALNYAEARSAESKKDFIHKMKVCLKELRETKVCLEIMILNKTISMTQGNPLLDEVNQLISIFVSSLKTLTKKQ